MNFLCYIRPPAADIDAIGKLGNEGWNWENYLAYAKLSERYISLMIQATHRVDPLLAYVVSTQQRPSILLCTLTHLCLKTMAHRVRYRPVPHITYTPSICSSESPARTEACRSSKTRMEET